LQEGYDSGDKDGDGIPDVAPLKLGFGNKFKQLATHLVEVNKAQLLVDEKLNQFGEFNATMQGKFISKLIKSSSDDILKA
jgi:hypothetical protein